MSIGELFRVGIGVLRTYIAETGAVMAQTGDAATEFVDRDDVMWWQHIGFISRPSKPKLKQAAAEVVKLIRGSYDVIIASRDLRGLKLAGSLKEGETCIYAAGENGDGQARILLKGDGTVAIYTLTGNADGGESVTIQVRPSGEIHIASPLGGVSITDGKITLISKAGSGLQLDADGFKTIGQNAIIGGNVTLGDATATGVATQASLTPLFVALAGLCTTLTTFVNSAAGVPATPAVQAAVATACTAVTTALALPTTFSQSTKAS